MGGETEIGREKEREREGRIERKIESEKVIINRNTYLLMYSR